MIKNVLLDPSFTIAIKDANSSAMPMKIYLHHRPWSTVDNLDACHPCILDVGEVLSAISTHTHDDLVCIIKWMSSLLELTGG